MNNQEKLQRLADIEGMDEIKMLQRAVSDCTAHGICMTCDYTTTVEPDQDRGYCEVCETQTVKSCLILAGII